MAQPKARRGPLLAGSTEPQRNGLRSSRHRAARAAHSLAIGAERKVGRAHTRFGQIEHNSIRARLISGESSSDRSNLFVSSREQARGSPTVRRHASDVETRVGMRQLGLAMRRNSTTRVFLRIDERSRPARRFNDLIGVKTHLAEHPEIGAESRGIDVCVHVERERFVSGGADHSDDVAVGNNLLDRNSLDYRDDSAVDSILKPRTQGPTTRQLVIGAAAEEPSHREAHQ